MSFKSPSVCSFQTIKEEKERKKKGRAVTQKSEKRNSIKTYKREEKAKRMMDFRMHKININCVKIK